MTLTAEELAHLDMKTKPTLTVFMLSHRLSGYCAGKSLTDWLNGAEPGAPATPQSQRKPSAMRNGNAVHDHRHAGCLLGNIRRNSLFKSSIDLTIKINDAVKRLYGDCTGRPLFWMLTQQRFDVRCNRPIGRTAF